MEHFQDPLNWLSQQRTPMKDMLCRWATINSGSYHLKGLQAMADELSQAFGVLDATFNSIPLPDFTEVSANGELITYSTVPALHLQRKAAGRPRILLFGHFDTVYGPDHPFQQLQELNDNTINGPGVADMKGGLVVMLFALKALEQSAWAGQCEWEVILNPDEEIGSPASNALFIQLAVGHQLAIGFEPALTPEGQFVSIRKGAGKFQIVATGRAAHAGRDFSQGRNAILGLAACLQKIDALNGERDGVTINIGKIRGGDAVNTVPDKAVAYLDVRISKAEDAAWLQQAIQDCVTHLNGVNDIQLVLHGDVSRLPKDFDEKHQRWFSDLQTTGEALKQTITWGPSGGVCDGNTLAAQGLAVIDSMGVCGASIHSEREVVYIDSLVERAQLTALLLMRLAAGELEVNKL